jgi:hypothetical protein
MSVTAVSSSHKLQYFVMVVPGGRSTRLGDCVCVCFHADIFLEFGPRARVMSKRKAESDESDAKKTRPIRREEDVPECPVCNDYLVDAICRPCGHALCTNCTRIIMLCNKNECPECREKGPEGMWNIRPNISITNHVQAVISEKEYSDTLAAIRDKDERLVETLVAWIRSILDKMENKYMFMKSLCMCIQKAYNIQKSDAESVTLHAATSPEMQVFGFGKNNLEYMGGNIIYHKDHAKSVLRSMFYKIGTNYDMSYYFGLWIREAEKLGVRSKEWECVDPGLDFKMAEHVPDFLSRGSHCRTCNGGLYGCTCRCAEKCLRTPESKCFDVPDALLAFLP